MRKHEIEEFFNKARNRDPSVSVNSNSGHRKLCRNGHTDRGHGRLVTEIKNVLCDLMTMPTYWEAWVPTLIACSVVMIWLFFAFAHTVPNPYRSILLWLFFSILVCGVAIINPEGRAG